MLPAAAPQKRGAAGTCSTLGCSHGLFMTRDPKMTLEKPSYFGVSVKMTLNWQRGRKKIAKRGCATNSSSGKRSKPGTACKDCRKQGNPDEQSPVCSAERSLWKQSMFCASVALGPRCSCLNALAVILGQAARFPKICGPGDVAAAHGGVAARA